MNSDSILRKVQKTYLEFRSCSDRGTVDRIPPIGETSLDFRTYFVRPSMVRFEWSGPHFEELPPDENIFCTNGEQVQMMFLNKLRFCSSLSNAMDCATGVSSASVYQILKLLLPECLEVNRIWYEMRNARRLEDEEISGWPCYHLVGTSVKHDDEEVWISHDDFIVRRRLHRTHVTLQESARRNARNIERLRSKGLPVGPPIKPEARKYTHTYNYNQVIVNKPISAALFESV